MNYQNFVFQGLGTLTYVVPEAGLYFVEGKSSIPTLTNGQGVSALVATVNVNGSPSYTGVAGAQGFRCNVSCSALDIITVVWTSAAAPDLALNAIKSTVEIGLGE